MINCFIFIALVFLAALIVMLVSWRQRKSNPTLKLHEQVSEIAVETTVSPPKFLPAQKTKPTQKSTDNFINLLYAAQFIVLAADLFEKNKQDEAERQPPENRGGRPRGNVEGETSGKEESEFKPEIICVERRGKWVIGVEVPENKEDSTATQDDIPLDKSPDEECFFPLKFFNKDIKIIYDGQEKLLTLTNNNDCLIFKTQKNWKQKGRMVRKASVGYLLVVVPKNWERDIEVSGHASNKPEEVHLPGFKAHFFYLEKDSQYGIGFVKPDGEKIRLDSGGIDFSLEGKEIPDASEEFGPLYAKEPPLIKVFGEHGWSEVGTIVVGEEGPGRNRWKTSFIPKQNSKILEMPDDLKERGGGWYFIRFYDNNNELMDSMDFRFMNDLKDVRVSPYTPLPSEEGHKSVEVCFEHQPELEITLGGDFLTLDRKNDTTKVIIPSKPDFNLTEWKLKSDNVELSIKILIERVWWLIKRGNESSEENFQDKPVNIHRDYCRTISEDSIIIMYPKEGWAKSVFLGFDDKTRREYHVKVKDKFSTINLRDFSDIMDLTPSTISAEIKLWIDIRTQGSCETIICKITPEESPPPQVPPEIPEEPQIFIRLDSDPYSRPSCNNCDYARTQAEGFSPPIFWCKKNKWFYANRLKFYGHFGYCLCGDWEGEYQDIIGEWQYELRQEEIELLVKKGLKK